MTDAKILVLPVETTLDLPVDTVLQGAIDDDLSQVLIIGTDDDGNLKLFSSDAAWSEIFVLLERAKLHCLRQIDS